MKIGILGCSSIAKRCIIPAIKQTKDLELVGVASRSKTKAMEWGNLYDVKSYTYEDLISSDVDAIYISLPPALHYDWGKKVLLSNKHLLMEKTFTSNELQAVDLFNIAEKGNLKCMEALMYEFHPVHNKIDSLLYSLGNLKHVEANFCFPYIFNPNDIRYSKSLGGGAILDSLIYPLSFVYRILGNKFLEYNKFFITNNIVERGSLAFNYGDSFANINFGFGQAYRNEITICGSDKILKAERVFSRTENCTNPIEIKCNGKSDILEVNPSNHFVKMLEFFISNEDLAKKSQNTLTRLKFMDNIRICNY